jgi:hypothetical protein
MRDKTFEILAHAVTEYDRKQKDRADACKDTYNPYALPQYLAGVINAVERINAGADLREAVKGSFHGRLLDVCLKALGLPAASRNELRGWE